MNQKKIYLANPAVFLEATSKKKKDSGKISGEAYTGALIKQHGLMQNLIVDIDSLTIAKEKSPILFNHDPADPIGTGQIYIEDGLVKIDGQIFEVTESGKKVRDLAAEGYDWQLSIGVFDYDEDFVDEDEVNGRYVQNATVLRNAVLREVSIVTLGADGATSAQVLEQKGAKAMFMTKEEWVKFACSCGGDKNTTPKELAKRFQDAEEAIEAVEELEEKVEKLEEEVKEVSEEKKDLEEKVEELEEEVEELEEELEEVKEDDEREEREEELRRKVRQMGLSISDKKIKAAARTSVGFKLLMSFIGEAKEDDRKRRRKSFGGRVDLGSKGSPAKKGPEAIALAAENLVREGKAKDFMEALEMVEG